MLLGDVSYYEIFLLSLRWLGEESLERTGKVSPRSVSPTLYTLKEVGVINEGQRRAAMQNAALRNRLQMKIVVCSERVGYTLQDFLEYSIAQSPKPLALPLATGAVFDRRLIMARNGYKYLLTASGLALAKKKESAYEDIITRDRFLRGHAAMRDQISRAMASAATCRNKQGSTTDEEFNGVD